ncbi:hypothetical protein [Zobellella sp. DQSA1]|uniref:hypothetical protein n=1 Tax=Zobellella sp. DQSA1 TaxID=3342386 RepID=UPI0035C22676
MIKVENGKINFFENAKEEGYTLRASAGTIRLQGQLNSQIIDNFDLYINEVGNAQQGVATSPQPAGLGLDSQNTGASRLPLSTMLAVSSGQSKWNILKKVTVTTWF